MQKQKLAEETYLLRLKAPEIAKTIKPGQYFLLQINDEKRIPLSVAGVRDPNIYLVVQESDPHGPELIKHKKGDVFESIIGPLGQAIEPKELGNILIVTEGSGLGQALVIAQAFKKFENRVYFIAGFKHKKQKYWETQAGKIADKTFFVIERKNQTLTHPVIKEVHHLLRRKHIHLVLANCNPLLLKEIVTLSKLRSKVLSSMLPLVKDSMGMCGACRLTAGNETKLACLDGPFMAGHNLDWEEVLSRYKNQLPAEPFCRKYILER